MGERLVRPVDVAVQAGYQSARFRAGNGRGRVGLRHRGREHPKLGPFRLQPHFQPGQHGGGVAGRRGHHKMFVAKPGGHAVVEDHPVFVAHQPVAGAADLQLRPVVGVDAVEQRRDVRPLEVDLAQRRGVHRADAVAHRPDFAVDRGLQRFAVAAIGIGPLPLADILEHRAVGGMPVEHRRLAHRIEQGAAVPPGQRAERNRRVGRTEGRSADGLRRPAGFHAHQRQADHIGGLALVGAHAQRCVALEMLDGAIVLPRRQGDILDRHIVLQIDERFALAAARPAAGDGPQRLDRRRRRFVAGLQRRLAGALRPAGRPGGIPGRRHSPAPGNRRGCPHR